jgi:hypothetical protein
VYWPFELIVPGPELASPPETVQATVAAPPLARVAENCSTGVPEALLLLQPVQLVSMAVVGGAIEKTPFDAPPALEPAVQPAIANITEIAAAAPNRADHRSSRRDRLRRSVNCEEQTRSSVGFSVVWLNSSGAFLLFPTPGARTSRNLALLCKRRRLLKNPHDTALPPRDV